jgi:Flp pilus assembly protein TadG
VRSDREGSSAGGWRRFTSQAGNTLLLFPAALLVLLALGGLAVDAATLFLSQRRMVDLAAATANDAVAGIELAAFYEDDAIVVDLDRASVRSQQLRTYLEEDWSLSGIDCTVTTNVERDRATAVCRAEVRPIFAPVWGDGRTTREVTATETVRGVER